MVGFLDLPLELRLIVLSLVLSPSCGREDSRNLRNVSLVCHAMNAVASQLIFKTYFFNAQAEYTYSLSYEDHKLDDATFLRQRLAHFVKVAPYIRTLQIRITRQVAEIFDADPASEPENAARVFFKALGGVRSLQSVTVKGAGKLSATLWNALCAHRARGTLHSVSLHGVCDLSDGLETMGELNTFELDKFYHWTARLLQLVECRKLKLTYYPDVGIGSVPPAPAWAFLELTGQRLEAITVTYGQGPPWGRHKIRQNLFDFSAVPNAAVRFTYMLAAARKQHVLSAWTDAKTELPFMFREGLDAYDVSQSHNEVNISRPGANSEKGKDWKVTKRDHLRTSEEDSKALDWYMNRSHGTS